MKKLYILLVTVIAIALVAVLIKYQLQMQGMVGKNSPSIFTSGDQINEQQTENQNVTFDKVREDHKFEDFMKAIKKWTVASQEQVIKEMGMPIQVDDELWESGAISHLVLPMEPSHSIETVNEGSLHRLEASSPEYNLRIYHFLNLDDSEILCKGLTAKERLQQAAELTSIKDITLENAVSAVQYEFYNPNYNSNIVAITACYSDGKNRAWSIGIEVPEKFYKTKYERLIPIMFKNFQFIY